MIMLLVLLIFQSLQKQLLIFLKKFVLDGGIFMWVILITWAVGVGISLFKYLSFKRYRVNEEQLYEEVKKRVLSGKVEEAISICSNSKAILPRILNAGLQRVNGGKEKLENGIYLGELPFLLYS